MQLAKKELEGANSVDGVEATLYRVRSSPADSELNQAACRLIVWCTIAESGFLVGSRHWLGAVAECKRGAQQE